MRGDNLELRFTGPGMLSIRMLSVEDTSLFVEVRRLSLSTDPDSFSARLETDAFDAETATQYMKLDLTPL